MEGKLWLGLIEGLYGDGYPIGGVLDFYYWSMGELCDPI